MKMLYRIVIVLIIVCTPTYLLMHPKKKCLKTKVVYPTPYDIATCMQSCHYNCADCGKFKIVCDKYEE